MFGVNFVKDEPILHGIDAKVSLIRGCAGNFELVQRIVETYKITDILHAAAIPNVREVQRMSEDEIEGKDAEFSNCRVLENLLAAIDIASIKTTMALKTLTFLSSSTVYGQVRQDSQLNRNSSARFNQQIFGFVLFDSSS